MDDFTELSRNYDFLARRVIEALTTALRHHTIPDELDVIVDQLDHLADLATKLQPLYAQSQEQERERLAAIRQRVRSEWSERYQKQQSARSELCAQHRRELAESPGARARRCPTTPSCPRLSRAAPKRSGSTTRGRSGLPACAGTAPGPKRRRLPDRRSTASSANSRRFGASWPPCAASTKPSGSRRMVAA